MAAPFTVGEVWYLVPQSWVDGGSESPLDCSDLGVASTLSMDRVKLRADAMLDLDFALMPSDELSAAVAVCGRVPGAPLFPRTVVAVNGDDFAYVDFRPTLLRAVKLNFGHDVHGVDDDLETAVCTTASSGGGGSNSSQNGALETKTTEASSDDDADDERPAAAAALLRTLPSVVPERGAVMVPRKASLDDVVALVCAHFEIELSNQTATSSDPLKDNGHLELYRLKSPPALFPRNDWARWERVTRAGGMQWLTNAGLATSSPSSSELLVVERCFKVGDRVDARDSAGVWYESEIVDCSAPADVVTVHFRAWSSDKGAGGEFDEVIPRDSARLRPAWSEITPFRHRMKKGDKLDFKFETKWWPIKVHSVDGEICSAKVNLNRILNEKKRAAMNDQLQCVTRDSYLLAPARTHTAHGNLQKDTSGKSWLRSAIGGSTRPSSTSSFASSSSSARSHHPIGVFGLKNLGNTCFMNSMLQCLNAVEPLVDVLREKDSAGVLLWGEASQLNTLNPIGTQGELTASYARFVDRCWSGDSAVVSPSGFKKILGKHDSRFRGYSQEDASELFNSLVDKLHEDMNKVSEPKPFVPDAEWEEGDTDTSLALRSWDVFRKRNISPIMDIFFGSFKSKLRCDKVGCGNTSLKFDSFMSIPFPIPSLPQEIEFTLVRRAAPMFPIMLPADATYTPKRVRIRVHLADGNNAATLKEKVTALCGIAPECLLVCKFHLASTKKTDYPQFIECALRDSDCIPVNKIAAGRAQIVVFELSPAHHAAAMVVGERDAESEGGALTTESLPPARILVTVAHRRQGNSLFGYPLVLSFPANATVEDLHREVAPQIRPLVLSPIQLKEESAQWRSTALHVLRLGAQWELPSQVLHCVADFLPLGPRNRITEMSSDIYTLKVSSCANYKKNARLILLPPIDDEAGLRTPLGSFNADLSHPLASRGVFVCDWSEGGMNRIRTVLPGATKKTASLYDDKKTGALEETISAAPAPITLYDCIAKFSEAETLDFLNTWCV